MILVIISANGISFVKVKNGEEYAQEVLII